MKDLKRERRLRDAAAGLKGNADHPRAPGKFNTKPQPPTPRGRANGRGCRARKALTSTRRAVKRAGALRNWLNFLPKLTANAVPCAAVL